MLLEGTTVIADRLAGFVRDESQKALTAIEAKHATSRERYVALVESKGVRKIVDKLKAVELPTQNSQPFAGRRAEPPARAGVSRVVPTSATTSEPRRPGVPAASGNSDLDGTQQRTLDTIAMLNVRGIDVKREAVARWMSIHPNGGRFLTGLARLRDEGYLDGFRLTEKGAAAARVLETGSAAALAVLKDGTQDRTLRVLLEVHPQALSREQIAERLGIHPNGGRFLTGLARLREMGVITERSPISATEGVFV